MTAFNAVRFKVKPGREQEFLEGHRSVSRDWPGLRHVNMIQTGEGSYCIIGEWDSFQSLGAALRRDPCGYRHLSVAGWLLGGFRAFVSGLVGHRLLATPLPGV